MELHELIAIFRNSKKLFWSIFGLCVAIAVLYFLFQSQTYRTTLTLNVAREGSIAQQHTQEEYNYDDFYRLQADERFADTVVRWLQSPRIVSDIYTDADLPTRSWSVQQYRGAFSARRLSSQVIDVEYVVTQPESGHALAQSLVTRLNGEARTLNTSTQQREGWFRVQGGTPVVTDNIITLRTLLSIGVIAGAFIAFWGVIIAHYAHRDRHRYTKK